MTCNIDIDGKEETYWIEVEDEYKEYLCYERSDAFLIGFLNVALRSHHDIICDTPVTEELLYNLNTLFIPALTRACF